MKPRTSLIDKFSAFLELSLVQGVIQWKLAPNLAHHMNQLVQTDPEAHAEFWARKFLALLREVSEKQAVMERQHLAAYLQESAFWAAKSVFKKFAFLQYLQELWHLALLDLPQERQTQFKRYVEIKLKIPQNSLDQFEGKVNRFVADFPSPPIPIALGER